MALKKPKHIRVTRRQFVASSGAAVAAGTLPALAQAPGPMDGRLRLFGVTLEVVDGIVSFVRPGPGFTIKEAPGPGTHVVASGNSLALVIRGVTIESPAFSVEIWTSHDGLPLERVDPGQFRFKPGSEVSIGPVLQTLKIWTKGESTGPNGRWALLTPWFAMSDAGANAAGVVADANGELALRIPRAVPLMRPQVKNQVLQIPFELHSSRIIGRVSTLDIPSGTLVLPDGALCLSLNVGALKQEKELPASGGQLIRHDSEQIQIDLNGSALTIRFAESDNWLPLNATRNADGKGPLRSTLAASSYALAAGLKATGEKTSLLDLSLVSRASRPGYKLATSLLVDSRDVPIEWTGTEPLALRVRPSGNSLASGLLIAGHNDTPLKLMRARTMYGVLANSRFKGISRAMLRGARPGASWPQLSGLSSNLPELIPAPDELFAADTRVVLDLVEGVLERAKPGKAFRKQEAKGGADTWAFGGNESVPIPLVPRELSVAKSDYATFIDALNDDVQAKPRTARVVGKSVHETLLTEQPPSGAASSSLSLQALFSKAPATVPPALPAPAPADAAGAPQQISVAIAGSDDSFRLQPVDSDFGFEPFTLRLQLQGRNRAFIPIHDDELSSSTSVEGTLTFDLDSASVDFQAVVELKPGNAGRKLIGMLKLTDERSLRDILAEKDFDPINGKQVANDLHRDILEPSWKGLLLFGTRISVDKSKLYKKIIPSDQGKALISLVYFAMTPRKTSKGEMRQSLYARINWKSRQGEAPPALDVSPRGEQEESHFRLEELDVEWANSSMERFSAAATVCVQSFFGIRWQGGEAPKISIKAYLQHAPVKEIRWVGSSSRPIYVLDSEAGTSFGPIKKASISGATIAVIGSEVEVQLDGDVELQNLEFQSQKYFQGVGRLVRFVGLGLRLPEAGQSWRALRVSYPSLRLDLNLPHFDFLGLSTLQIKIRGLGVNWSDRGDLDWSGWMSLADAGAKLRKAFFVDFDLSFGKLPALCGKSFKEMKFGFRFGIGIEGGRIGRNWDIRLGAVGFKSLNLELMRFLSVRARDVEFRTQEFVSKTGEKRDAPWIVLKDVSIAILDVSIVKGLSITAFTTPEGRRGFLLSCGDESDPMISSDLLKLYWIVIGRNLFFPERLARELLSLDRLPGGGEGETPPEHANAIKALKDAAGDAQLLLKNEAGNRDVGEWVFGAGIGVLNNFLQGKFLFQDANVYGLALWGQAFEEWFGQPFGISGLYFKRDNPSEDSIVLSTTIPGFSPGPFRFTGGTITVEWAFNGSFLFDAGFPWSDGQGSRRWDRTLGAVITPFQGSGGTYLRYRKTSIAPKEGVAKDRKFIQLACGFAVQFGLGATFGTGSCFVVWVRIGLYAVIEGDAWLEVTNRNDYALRALHLVGAFGILVEGYGQLDVWIISIRVGVLLSAEARAEVFWIEGGQENGPVPYLLCLGPQASGQETLPSACTKAPPGKVELRMTFELAARVYAQACIGPKGFRVCKSFRIKTAISVSKSVIL